MDKNLNIVIALHPKGGWNVEHDGKLADRLAWDEMLGLVAQITMPDERRCCSWLKTPEEIAAWEETYGKANPGEVNIITDVDFENQKTEISDFLLAVKKTCSTRLYNVLRCVDGVTVQTNSITGEKYNWGYDYIEEITDSEFLKIRNAGKHTLAEFKGLKELYYGTYNFRK